MKIYFTLKKGIELCFQFIQKKTKVVEGACNITYLYVIVILCIYTYIHRCTYLFLETTLMHRVCPNIHIYTSFTYQCERFLRIHIAQALSSIAWAAAFTEHLADTESNNDRTRAQHMFIFLYCHPVSVQCFWTPNVATSYEALLKSLVPSDNSPPTKLGGWRIFGRISSSTICLYRTKKNIP